MWVGARAGRGRRNALSASAVPRPARASALATAVAIVAVMLAIVPVSVEVSPCELNLNVHKSEANAATPFAGAYSLLELYASAAGITSSEFVTTVIGAGTVYSGMVLARDAGVSYGSSIDENLGNIIDAAEYPDWSTLSAEEQQSWGNKENYDSAKLHSFLNGFGFEDTYTRYQGFYEEGGGSFDFTVVETERLEQIGRIGQEWMNKGGVTLSQLGEIITSRNAIFGAVYGSPTYVADGTNIENWPTQIPETFPMAYGNHFRYKSPNVNAFFYVVSPGEVYGFTFWNGSNAHHTVLWSDKPFMYGSFQDFVEVTPTTAAKQSGNVYLMHAYSTHVNGQVTGDLPETYISSWFYGDAPIVAALNLLVDAQRMPESNYVPDLPGYPEDVAEDTEVYIPDGVTPDMTWDNYTDQPPIPRPENPYNPDDQTGGDEWKQNTRDNVLPLQNIKFDKLFPFSLLYDVPKMVTKVQELTVSSGAGDYSEISIPMETGDISEEIVLDLEPVHQLLLMTRPFTLILLIVGLLMALVAFWRNILTG